MQNEKYLGLIYKVALDVISKSELCKKNIGIEKEEYVGIGYIALAVAKKNFKIQKKIKFSTFAYKIIRDYFIKYAIKNSTHIKIGNAYRYQAWRVVNGKQKTRGKNKSIDLAVKALKSNHADINLSLIEKHNENKQFDWSDVEFLHKNLNKMDEKTKEIISLRYGLNDNQSKTLRQIGEMLGISFEMVRQIEKKGIEMLRKNMVKSA